VLGVEEVRALAAAVDALPIQFSRAGARHVLKYPPIAAIAADSRLTSIAADWLGGGAIPFKATLFDKNPAANWLVAWHQDTALPLAMRQAKPGWGPWSVKDGITYAHAPARALDRVIALRLHLDDSTTDNGPLRVLPGTHRLGVLSDADVGLQAERVASHECCAAAGGVVAMRPLIIHASSKCLDARPRRVLHIEYAVSMEILPGMRLQAA
jgi:ectoine hydroxylase-related dioxygenase (phytanoyl-CoA dioxygenase family)